MRGLYAIVDPAACRRDPFEIARELLRGGCAALQLRDKHASDDDFVALALRLRAACNAASLPFFINDRVWLAPQLAGCGLHVGQDDMPIAEVRQRCGATRLLGVSTHSVAQAEAAARAGADLLGFGPVFETHSKAHADPVVGLAALTRVCARVSIPVVAIGGIQVGNAASVAAAGARMGAAISALCGAEAPERAARELHALLGGVQRSPAQ